MKKAKMLPSILMLVLCVGVLAMGVYAAMPISHSLNGTISVTAAGAEVAITAYLDNSGLGDDTVMSDVITTRNNSTIQLTQDIEFNCESVSVGEQDKVPSKKLYLEIQNKSSIALGAYFYDTDSNLASTGTTKNNIATTKTLGEVVTADFTGYTQIPVGGTVKVYCIFTLNEVGSEAVEINLTNQVKLNIEPYNQNLETTPSTENAINFTNASNLAVQVACNKTTASVATNAALETEAEAATRVALGNLSWEAGAASFASTTWGDNGELRLQPVKLKMQVKNNDTVPVKVTVSTGTGNVAQSASISVSTIGNNYIAPGTTEEVWVQFEAVVTRSDTAITSLTNYAISNYNFNVAIEKSTESGTIEIKDDADNAEANRSYLYAQGYRYYVEMGENPYSTTTPKAKLRWYIWAEDDGNGSPKVLTSTPTTGDGNIYYFISEYTLDEGNTQTEGKYSSYFGLSFQNEYDYNEEDYYYYNPLEQYASAWTGSNLRNYLNGNTVRRTYKANSNWDQYKSDGLNVNFYETFKLTESPIFSQIIGRSVDELYSSDSGYASNSGEFDTRFAGQADKFWALSYSEVSIIGWGNKAISYQLSGGTEKTSSSSWWLRSPDSSSYEWYVSVSGDGSNLDVDTSGVGSRPAFKIQI